MLRVPRDGHYPGPRQVALAPLVRIQLSIRGTLLFQSPALCLTSGFMASHSPGKRVSLLPSRSRGPAAAIPITQLARHSPLPGFFRAGALWAETAGLRLVPVAAWGNKLQEGPVCPGSTSYPERTVRTVCCKQSTEPNSLPLLPAPSPVQLGVLVSGSFSLELMNPGSSPPTSARDRPQSSYLRVRTRPSPPTTEPGVQAPVLLPSIRDSDPSLFFIRPRILGSNPPPSDPGVQAPDLFLSDSEVQATASLPQTQGSRPQSFSLSKPRGPSLSP
jgi:hypothetical protein